MSCELGRSYRHVWCVDFEYFSGDSKSDAPRPICVVAHDLITGRTIRKWLWGNPSPQCPFPLGDDCLYVAYYAAAEVNCHIALGWPVPTRILDLYAEFRCLNNGRNPERLEAAKACLKKNERHSLLACMFAYGLANDAVNAGRKDEMRNLCMRGGPYSSGEQRQILGYCHSDVVAITKLLPRMMSHIELGLALLRGRYMASVAAMERRGIPVDVERADGLKIIWEPIVDRLIHQRRHDLDVIGHRDVDHRKFTRWLAQHSLDASWPRCDSGIPRSDSETLSDWSTYHPAVLQLKEFLQAVRRVRLFEELSIGSDGRNRFMISPFGSKTGRNTPSSSRSVFGPACWVRSLIQPPPGYALLYCDWSGQEYGIAAYLSGDRRMIDDYATDDPYLGFAKRIGLAPRDATKATHPQLRNQLKVAAGLGVLYGAQAATVARAGAMTESRAAHVLREHRSTYPTYWQWRQRTINHAQLTGEFKTCFGWKWQVSGDDSTNSISNWMMQAHGAEMLHVACCLAVERGVEVCTPVHDALLVQAPVDAINDVQRLTVECMEEASSAVLRGPPLRIGVEPPIEYPNHYSDERGIAMWQQLTDIQIELEREATG